MSSLPFSILDKVHTNYLILVFSGLRVFASVWQHVNRHMISINSTGVSDTNAAKRLFFSPKRARGCQTFHCLHNGIHGNTYIDEATLKQLLKALLSSGGTGFLFQRLHAKIFTRTNNSIMTPSLTNFGVHRRSTRFL